MRDRRAVLDLPLRLMLVMLVVSLSAPIALSAIEGQEAGAAKASMERLAQRVINASLEAHYGGVGSCRSITLDIPDGCVLEVGGPEGSPESLGVRCYRDGRLLATRYVEEHHPPLVRGAPLALEGVASLRLLSVSTERGAAVEVSAG